MSGGMWLLRLIGLLELLILIRVLLSWVAPNRNSEPMRTVCRITDPIMRPFRVVIPMGQMGLDIGPILALLAIQLIRNIVANLFGLPMY